MPYRYAHYVIVLVLIPAIAVAFWPAYFGTLSTAPFALHAHGITASIWVLLVAGQSWTAHTRRFAWHRVMARGVLVVAPLFAGAAALVIQSMAVKFVTRSSVFNTLLGARLGMDDLLTTIVFVWMVRAAIRNRRRVGLHAAYMLSTVLLVLPPVIARLPVPQSLFVSYGVMIAAALALYAVRRRDGLPFLITAGLGVWRVVQFETVAASDAWARTFAVLAHVPTAPLAGAAVIAAVATIWPVWPWQAPKREALPAG